MNHPFKLTVLSSDKVFFDGDALSICFVGGCGSLEVLAGHASLVSLVQEGAIVITGLNHEKIELQAKSGFFQIQNDLAVVCLTDDEKDTKA